MECILPTEILIKIFKLCGNKELLSICHSSKHFQILTIGHNLWLPRIECHSPKTIAVCREDSSNIDILKVLIVKKNPKNCYSEFIWLLESIRNIECTEFKFSTLNILSKYIKKYPRSICMPNSSSDATSVIYFINFIIHTNNQFTINYNNNSSANGASSFHSPTITSSSSSSSSTTEIQLNSDINERYILVSSILLDLLVFYIEGDNLRDVFGNFLNHNFGSWLISLMSLKLSNKAKHSLLKILHYSLNVLANGTLLQGLDIMTNLCDMLPSVECDRDSFQLGFDIINKYIKFKEISWLTNEKLIKYLINLLNSEKSYILENTIHSIREICFHDQIYQIFFKNNIITELTNAFCKLDQYVLKTDILLDLYKISHFNRSQFLNQIPICFVENLVRFIVQYRLDEDVQFHSLRLLSVLALDYNISQKVSKSKVMKLLRKASTIHVHKYQLFKDLKISMHENLTVHKTPFGKLLSEIEYVIFY